MANPLLLPDFIFSLALGFLVAEIFALGFAGNHAAFSLRWWGDFLGFGILTFISTAAGRVMLGLAGRTIGFFMPYAAATVIMAIFCLAPSARSRPADRGRGTNDAGDIEVALVVVLLIALSTLIVFDTAIS